jgi:hypothetical protein
VARMAFLWFPRNLSKGSGVAMTQSINARDTKFHNVEQRILVL